MDSSGTGPIKINEVLLEVEYENHGWYFCALVFIRCQIIGMSFTYLSAELPKQEMYYTLVCIPYVQHILTQIFCCLEAYHLQIKL